MKALHRPRILLAVVPLAGVALAAAGCGSGAANAPVRLDAGPATAAFVAPVHVSISGLPATGLVTVQAQTVGQKGQPWRSRRCSGRYRRDAQPGHGGAGLRQLRHRRRRRAAVVAAPGIPQLHNQPAQRIRARLHRPAHGADRRARPGDGDPPAPADGHGQHSDGAPARLRRDAVHLGRGQARRPAVVALDGDGENRATAKGLAMSGYPALALGYSTNPGCRSASAPSRWSISPAPSAGCAPSPRPADARWSCTAFPIAPSGPAGRLLPAAPGRRRGG